MHEKPRRGRPVILTPEEKLRRQRNSWKRKTANRRKEKQNAGKQLLSLTILHFNRLLEVLVAEGFLDSEDAYIYARIEEAVDKFLVETDFSYRYVSGYDGPSGGWSPYANSSNTVAKGMEAHSVH